MKKLPPVILAAILAVAVHAQDVPKDWKKALLEKKEIYVQKYPSSEGNFYFGCQNERIVNRIHRIDFELQTKQFLMFKPRKIIKIKVVLKNRPVSTNKKKSNQYANKL